MYYKIEGDQYGVVAVQESGMSASDVRKKAMQRAAEVTVSNGARYFVIQKEQQTQIVQSDKSDQNAFGGNMYQELIIEHDFGKESLSKQTPNAGVRPALRLVFQIYKDKPNAKAIDACKYTNCQ
jgi:hypothetical protein